MLTFLPIRWRLTIWYFCTLAAILALVAAGSWYAMRWSLYDALDRGLTYQLTGLREYVAASSPASAQDLAPRLAPILGLNDPFRVYDSQGRLICESTALTSHDVRLPAPLDADSRIRFRSAGTRGFPLRLAYQRYALGGTMITLEVADPIRKFETAIEDFRRILWFSLPVLLVVATLGGFWLSSRALRPVHQLTEDARAITASDLSRRLAVPQARDELRRLSETLNGMLDRIEGSFQRMRQFTADASHELRAPVTLIHMAAEFSLRRERSPEDLAENLKKILREAKRTTLLIDDLLLLARADSDPNAFPLHPVDLTPLLEDIADQAAALARPKGITVTKAYAPGPLTVNADEPSLRRLLLILVDNAIKYTVEGGPVKIEAANGPGGIRISVTDSGPGVAPEDLPHIFERFWRADRSRSRESGGTGLGLAIAKEIATRHHATLNARSQPGQGATFTLALPEKNFRV